MFDNESYFVANYIRKTKLYAATEEANYKHCAE